MIKHAHLQRKILVEDPQFVPPRKGYGVENELTLQQKEDFYANHSSCCKVPEKASGKGTESFIRTDDDQSYLDKEIQEKFRSSCSCKDGSLNISNVAAENAIRPFVIGKKDGCLPIALKEQKPAPLTIA